MLSSFLNEIEKLAGPIKTRNKALKRNYERGISGGRHHLALQKLLEARKPIGKAGELTALDHHERVARDRQIAKNYSASRKAMSRPVAPKAAVKAEAASGKKAISSLFKFVGEHKKLFGAIGGVGAATAGALAIKAVMNKRNAKPVAPKSATPVNA